ncbi:MAG TPA: hypothetical protein VN699_01710 [Pirellulales bacterium]|jgi:hypothetical protein|nr:hypothetical protein [Pirellulales bacterium]
MASASGSQGGRDPDRRPARQVEGDPPASEESRLLEQVLASTSFATGEVNSLPAEELDALRQVARRHSGDVLSVQPVLEELIEAILGKSLRALAPPPAARRAMVAEIAQTLFDDAVTRERLETLWLELRESKP